MKDIQNISGSKVKLAVHRACDSQKITREELVVFVQKLLKKNFITFSLAGLDRMMRGELPRRDTQEILLAVAEVCCCSVEDFAESEAKTA